MAITETIHDHGYQHFEDLQLSAKEFYDLLENMVKEFKYPDVTCKTEELKEGGIFSGKRQYYTINWKRHTYYVCASPFGKSFFISWWHKEGANTGANVASKFGILGKAVANNMESKSFFDVDTEMMFVNCINSVIKQAIERVKATKGFKETNPQVLN